MSFCQGFHCLRLSNLVKINEINPFYRKVPAIPGRVNLEHVIIFSRVVNYSSTV